MLEITLISRKIQKPCSHSGTEGGTRSACWWNLLCCSKIEIEVLHTACKPKESRRSPRSHSWGDQTFFFFRRKHAFSERKCRHRLLSKFAIRTTVIILCCISVQSGTVEDTPLTVVYLVRKRELRKARVMFSSQNTYEVRKPLYPEVITGEKLSNQNQMSVNAAEYRRTCLFGSIVGSGVLCPPVIAHPSPEHKWINPAWASSPASYSAPEVPCIVPFWPVTEHTFGRWCVRQTGTIFPVRVVSDFDLPSGKKSYSRKHIYGAPHGQ